MTTHDGYNFERFERHVFDQGSGMGHKDLPAYEEWTSIDPEGVITIQKEDGHKKPYTFSVMFASGPYAVGPYPGTPEWDEVTIAEGEALTFEIADAAARAAIAAFEKMEREEADAEARMYEEMESARAIAEDPDNLWNQARRGQALLDRDFEGREDFGYFGDSHLVGE